MDAQDEDARIIRLTELLEAALELVSSAQAADHLAEISRLCRQAADLSQA